MSENGNPTLNDRKRMSFGIYLLIYTVLFVITAAVVFSFFYVTGKSFIHSEDGIRQHYKSLCYFASYGREVLSQIFSGNFHGLPTYSFSFGEGADIYTTLHYYVIGDPLTLLSLLVPAEYMSYMYCGLIVLRIYLSGLTFSVYCRYMKQKYAAGIMTGAFVYAFCGFSLVAGMRHPFFINPMIYLPLILTGVERVIRERKPAVLILSVFVAAASNFYFLYMLAALTVIYTLIRLFLPWPKGELKVRLASFLRIAGCAVTGLMMSAFILIPVLIQFSGEARADVSYAVDLLYSASYYDDFLISIIKMADIGNYTLMGYSFIVLIGIMLLFTHKGKKTQLRFAFLLGAFMLLFPVFAYIMHGFSYVSNRWIFGYGFLIAYIVTDMWGDLISLDRKKCRKLAAAACVYFIVCAGFEVYSGFISQIDKKDTALLIGTDMLTIFVILAARVLVSCRKKNCIKLNIMQYVTVATVIFSIMVNGLITFYPGQEDSVKRFVDMTKVDNIQTTPEKKLDEMTSSDEDFFRYSGNSAKVMTRNGTIITGMSSTQAYWSLSNTSILKGYKELLVSIADLSFIGGADTRTAVEEISSVKYHLSDTSGSDVPYGYELIGDEKDQIYENRMALPLGYTYSSYITPQQYNEMSPLQRQEAVLQGVYLDKNDSEDMASSGYSGTNVSLTSTSVPYKVKAGEGVTFRNGAFVVSKGGSSVTFTFDGKEDSETYLYIKNLGFKGVPKTEYYSDEKIAAMSKSDRQKMKKYEHDYIEPSRFSLKLKAEDTNGRTAKKSFSILTEKFIRYNDRKDFLVNMYYSDDARKSMILTFPETGEYSYDDIQVMCQPMGNYEKQVSELGKDVMKNINIHANDVYATSEVTGDITLKNNKILSLSIPYSTGWTAYVDGRETKIMRANTMYTAIPVSAGSHHIELRYSTPGAVSGIGVSLTGLTLFLVIIVSGRIMRTREKRSARRKTQQV